ncbi:hypothetical protein BDP27DRAFT_184283 [Rhodocollybia butyracea]|uniref:Uncharacterized protein n=1 Tax=Rhodocollybia butyracea TaxID=206335 RepID=A0A9P5Q443_9AGAR|nr:hypothetical protein BDP27DRAFT_184283 [Rhodocollybia butyracea]
MAPQHVQSQPQHPHAQPRPMSSMSSAPSTPISPYPMMGHPPPMPNMQNMQNPNMFGQMGGGIGGIPHQAPRMQHPPYNPAQFGFPPSMHGHAGPSGPPPHGPNAHPHNHGPGGHGLAPSALPRSFTGGGHNNGPSLYDPATNFSRVGLGERVVPGAPGERSAPAPIGPPQKLTSLPSNSNTNIGAGPSSALVTGSSPIAPNPPRRMSVALGPIGSGAPITPVTPIAPIGPPIAPIARPSNSASTVTSESIGAGPSTSISTSVPSSSSNSPIRRSPARRSPSPKRVLGSKALAAEDDEVVPVSKGVRRGVGLGGRSGSVSQGINISSMGWGPNSPQRSAPVGGMPIGVPIGTPMSSGGPWGPPHLSPVGPVGMGFHVGPGAMNGPSGFGPPRSAGLWGNSLGNAEWPQSYPSPGNPSPGPNATPPPQAQTSEN